MNSIIGHKCPLNVDYCTSAHSQRGNPDIPDHSGNSVSGAAGLLDANSARHGHRPTPMFTFTLSTIERCYANTVTIASSAQNVAATAFITGLRSGGHGGPWKMARTLHCLYGNLGWTQKMQKRAFEILLHNIFCNSFHIIVVVREKSILH